MSGPRPVPATNEPALTQTDIALESLINDPEGQKAFVAHELEKIRKYLGLDSERFRQLVLELIGPWRAETVKDKHDKQGEPAVDLEITD